MLTHEGQMKGALADFRALESQARRKERDAKIEAETYMEAAAKIEHALYEIERLQKAQAALAPAEE